MKNPHGRCEQVARVPVVAFLVLALLGLALAPGVQACTSTRGPYQSVRFTATEQGVTVLDIPTSIQVGPNGLCGYDGTPPLSFDGRFAAWPTAQGLHVVDVTNGTQQDLGRGVLTRGHAALLEADGLRPTVTILDLANKTSHPVDAPTGQSFVHNAEGAVVALGAGPSGGEVRVSVLDPASGLWLIADAQVFTDDGDVQAASRDWVVLGDDQEATLLRLANGEVLHFAPQGQVTGIDGDRLYLRAPSGTNTWTSMGAQTWRTWSIHLPDASDVVEGDVPPQHTTVGGRSVAFVVQSTNTNGPSTTSSPTGTESRQPDDGEQSASTTTASARTTDRAGDGVIDVPLPGWAALAALALGAAWVRRRV